jgi:hypothetical protein
VLSVLLIYGALVLGLTRLSVWAETEMGAYPYKHEDWLRYLLPDLFVVDARERIMVIGPSAAREAVLVEPIARAFPGAHVFNGALSVGTIDDVLVSLEYIEGAYGAEALPNVLVLGLTPRFVANLPAERPLQPAIDRYSPHFNVEEGENGPVIAPKSALSGSLAWLRFHALKQTSRYRTAIEAARLRAVLAGRERCRGAGALCPYDWPSDVTEWVLARPKLVRFLGLGRLETFGLAGYLANEISPLRYSYDGRRSEDVLRARLENPESFWDEVFSWDPRPRAAETESRMVRLLDFATKREIEVFAVNLPENEICSAMYQPERYLAYRAVLESSLGDTPYLDLRSLLPRTELRDAVHVTLQGAERTTAAIVRLMEEHRQGNAIVNRTTGHHE